MSMHEPDSMPHEPNPRCDDQDENGTVCFGQDEGSAESPVTMASRFVNLRFHARGGLGEVFRAHDSSLNREVAMKFIRPSRAGEDASRAQFLMEGEITSRLDHPGVVPVYGLGETFDGRPFLAMRFIEAINAGDSPLGPASDIYSLGATLYYLLTGRRSVSGSATAEVLQSIRRGDFPPPRAVNRNVSRSLDAICRKAMALDRRSDMPHRWKWRPTSSRTLRTIRSSSDDRQGLFRPRLLPWAGT